MTGYLQPGICNDEKYINRQFPGGFFVSGPALGWRRRAVGMPILSLPDD